MHLVAIGYPGETTGFAAADAAEELSQELLVLPDAIAAISCNALGRYKVVTNHHQVGEGPTWAGFWALLFGMLYFLPVIGLALAGGLGAVVGKLERSGLDRDFQEHARDMLRPGTSAVFLLVDRVTPEEVASALSAFGGTMAVTPLRRETAEELQDALQGRVRIGD